MLEQFIQSMHGLDLFFDNADFHKLKIKVKISQHCYQNHSSIGEHEKKVCLPLVI
eukprot:UN23575